MMLRAQTFGPDGQLVKTMTWDENQKMKTYELAARFGKVVLFVHTRILSQNLIAAPDGGRIEISAI